eukprot:3303963-Prymnesium_polylepis.2
MVVEEVDVSQVELLRVQRQGNVQPMKIEPLAAHRHISARPRWRGAEHVAARATAVDMGCGDDVVTHDSVAKPALVMRTATQTTPAEYDTCVAAGRSE